jgi:hypothetical protein
VTKAAGGGDGRAGLRHKPPPRAMSKAQSISRNKNGGIASSEMSMLFGDIQDRIVPPPNLTGAASGRRIGPVHLLAELFPPSSTGLKSPRFKPKTLST